MAIVPFSVRLNDRTIKDVPVTDQGCSVLLLLLFYFLHYGQEPGLSVFNLARNYEHARKPSDSRGLSIWTVEVKIICRNKHCAHVRSILSGWMNEILKEKND